MGVEKERMKSEDECIYDSLDRICLGEILCINERYRHGRKSEEEGSKFTGGWGGGDQ